jgi:hypothetical protein
VSLPDGLPEQQENRLPSGREVKERGNRNISGTIRTKTPTFSSKKQSLF